MCFKVGYLLQGCRGAGVQGCGCAGLLGYRGAGVQDDDAGCRMVGAELRVGLPVGGLRLQATRLRGGRIEAARVWAWS